MTTDSLWRVRRTEICTFLVQAPSQRAAESKVAPGFEVAGRDPWILRLRYDVLFCSALAHIWEGPQEVA